MESPAKRRKLDPTGEVTARKPSSSASSRPHASTSTVVRAPRTDANSTTLQPTTNGVRSMSTHEAWKQAKALSQARKGKRLNLFGKDRSSEKLTTNGLTSTHAQQSPLKNTALASTPTKKQLDPLRNQQNVAQTPTPTKTRLSLDFFKQFSSPKPAAGLKSAENGLRRGGIVNGVGQQAQTNGDKRQAETDDADSMDDSEDGERFMTPESSTKESSATKGKGWAYEKPKKTFEDEIRDLENQAREEADQEEEDEDDDDTQRRSGRKSKPSRLAIEMELERRKSDSVRQHAKPLKAREPKRVPQDPPHPKPPAPAPLPDAMDVDKRLPIAGSYEVSNPTKEMPIAVTPIKARSITVTKPVPALKDVTFSQPIISAIQNIILEKLTGQRPVRLINLDDEYVKVSNLIAQTITAGESNSMLVIGARGSGKTALVNQILREQSAQNTDDFHVVRLSGFIHTDDKVALREIWRQLGREMEIEDDEGVSKNYADTMTRLLALLSHQVEGESEVTKSVIFVLDEFELFATHPRQTLLYNLFDIAQSRKAPIAVLGLTTRIDVAESLEKRVKSRFSHRYVHLSSAKSFAAFRDACKSALSIDVKDLSTEERERFGLMNQLTTKLEVGKKDEKNVTATWNSIVEHLLAHEEIDPHLRRIYYTTKSVPEFHGCLLMPLATLPTKIDIRSQELVDHFVNSVGKHSLRPVDSKLTILPSLSTLQLALLICAARLTNIHNCDTVPFAQAYEEYKVLASKAKLQASASGALAQGAGSRVSSKDVAKGAWEDLLELGLIMEDGNRGGRVDVGLEEIAMSGVELGSWGRWCKEI